MKTHEQFKKEFFEKNPDMEKLYLLDKKLSRLSSRIHQEREKQGMSVSELIEKSNISVNVMDNITNGEDYSVMDLLKIADVLGIKGINI